jgi:hypothetical protein
MRFDSCDHKQRARDLRVQHRLYQRTVCRTIAVLHMSFNMAEGLLQPCISLTV